MRIYYHSLAQREIENKRKQGRQRREEGGGGGGQKRLLNEMRERERNRKNGVGVAIGQGWGRKKREILKKTKDENRVVRETSRIPDCISACYIGSLRTDVIMQFQIQLL